MKIKPMLARLQNSLGRDDLIQQMVLLPEPAESLVYRSSQKVCVNLVVGYNGSPKSHAALDIAFWVAHQTHLATSNLVTVHAVYVEENQLNNQYFDILNFEQNQGKSGFTITQLKQTNKVLWQALNLAKEWQSSFQSHECFGHPSTQLRKIVESVNADILFLGCKSVNHPLIESLGRNFPCAVLGVPQSMDD
jgi:hypothetical protein